MPSSRGSSDPRIGPGFPTLQVDSLLSEPPGKSDSKELFRLGWEGFTYHFNKRKGIWASRYDKLWESN